MKFRSLCLFVLVLEYLYASEIIDCKAYIGDAEYDLTHLGQLQHGKANDQLWYTASICGGNSKIKSTSKSIINNKNKDDNIHLLSPNCKKGDKDDSVAILDNSCLSLGRYSALTAVSYVDMKTKNGLYLKFAGGDACPYSGPLQNSHGVEDRPKFKLFTTFEITCSHDDNNIINNKKSQKGHNKNDETILKNIKVDKNQCHFTFQYSSPAGCPYIDKNKLKNKNKNDKNHSIGRSGRSNGSSSSSSNDSDGDVDRGFVRIIEFIIFLVLSSIMILVLLFKMKFTKEALRSRLSVRTHDFLSKISDRIYTGGVVCASSCLSFISSFANENETSNHNSYNRNTDSSHDSNGDGNINSVTDMENIGGKLYYIICSLSNKANHLVQAFTSIHFPITSSNGNVNVESNDSLVYTKLAKDDVEFDDESI